MRAYAAAAGLLVEVPCHDGPVAQALEHHRCVPQPFGRSQSEVHADDGDGRQAGAVARERDGRGGIPPRPVGEADRRRPRRTPWTTTLGAVRTAVPPVPRRPRFQSRRQARANGGSRSSVVSRRGTSCRHSTSGSTARTTRAAAARSSRRSCTLYVMTRSTCSRSRRAHDSAAGARQLGGPDEAGVAAEHGAHDARLGTVAAAGQLARGRPRGPGR